MKKILIVSLKFRAAHVSHLVASYKQAIDIGLSPILYISSDFIPFLPYGIKYVTTDNPVPQSDISIFWFPALQNFSLMWKLKRKYRTKVIYVVHEPIEKYSTYIKSGNSHIWTIKFYLKYIATLSFLFLSDKIILPSKRAIELYSSQISSKINSNYCYLPLLYSDEKLQKPIERKYLSYIGTISPDHAYDKFISFITSLSGERDTSLLRDLKFLIATRYVVTRTPEIQELINSGKLIVKDGKPLTDYEINEAYASSYIVWNAYNRTTQSGVLSKAFMFGTPALILEKNKSEFTEHKNNVFACQSNNDYNQLKEGVIEILTNFNHYSICARNSFEKYFNYKNYNRDMTTIIESLS